MQLFLAGKRNDLFLVDFTRHPSGKMWRMLCHAPVVFSGEVWDVFFVARRWSHFFGGGHVGNVEWLKELPH